MLNTILQKQRDNHKQLLQMHQESTALVRELLIKTTDPVHSETKAGNPITFMTWEYSNPSKDDTEWKARKSPMYSPETKIILENGPYEENCLYRVTAEKNKSGYFEWTSIIKIDVEEVQ